MQAERAGVSPDQAGAAEVDRSVELRACRLAVLADAADREVQVARVQALVGAGQFRRDRLRRPGGQLCCLKVVLGLPGQQELRDGGLGRRHARLGQAHPDQAGQHNHGGDARRASLATEVPPRMPRLCCGPRPQPVWPGIHAPAAQSGEHDAPQHASCGRRSACRCSLRYLRRRSSRSTSRAASRLARSCRLS